MLHHSDQDQDLNQAMPETSPQQPDAQTPSKPKLRVQVKNQPAAQPIAQPQPKPKTHTEAKPQDGSSSKPKLKVQDKSQFQPQPKPQSTPTPAPQPKPQPQVQPKPQPTPQPKPTPQPQVQPKPEPKPKNQPKPAPVPTPEPPAKPKEKPCRTITVRRATHAYKEFDLHGLKNLFHDKWTVRIVLDDEEKGTLKANEEMTVRMDSNEHHIRFNILSPKYHIPAGTENYLAIYFHDKFSIGPEVDPFRDQLTDFVVNMFRGKGVRERISSPANYGHKVYLDVNSNGIRLYWTLDHNHAKGFKAWLTGEGEEKISYLDMGLFPMDEAKQPSGYWNFISDWLEDAILNDPQADMQKVDGGFGFRTTHSLY